MSLQKLYKELDLVEKMTEEEVCDLYNADNKKEIIDMILEDINAAENEAAAKEEKEQSDLDAQEEISWLWAESYKW